MLQPKKSLREREREKQKLNKVVIIQHAFFSEKIKIENIRVDFF